VEDLGSMCRGDAADVSGRGPGGRQGVGEA